MPQTIWTVTGRSESGDTYGPFVFDHAPTEDEKKTLIRKKCDWAEPDGPGDYGSYTYLTVQKTILQTAAAPSSTRTVKASPTRRR